MAFEAGRRFAQEDLFAAIPITTGNLRYLFGPGGLGGRVANGPGQECPTQGKGTWTRVLIREPGGFQHRFPFAGGQGDLHRQPGILRTNRDVLFTGVDLFYGRLGIGFHPESAD
jgi:hypothetical protein